tara:strand:+ start:2509 stop:3150 length:642 start_codon:yes stop_codon:yes gene_type:complete
MKIMVIVPHADDAEIGMGGTMGRLVAEGHDVKLVTAILPCETIDGTAVDERKEARRKESLQASDILGVENRILDLDPYDFSFNRRYTKIFDKILRDFGPNQVFTCWEGDSHQDHLSLVKILFVATRKNNCSMFMFENTTPGGITTSSFNPQLYMDVSNYINVKKASLSQYKSVFGDDESVLESVISRARYRGQQIGVEYAECFEVVKDIRYHD